jgi:formate dehydrogenase major subunit
MTNGWTDVANADVILVMGGNPAENHPVGFRFTMEAKRNRRARIVTVDPRFNRTAAVSDIFVPIRAGSDIAFLGGLLHYALSNDLYHREYVATHTNAPFLVQDGYAFENGLFSGWDGESGTYDTSTWGYELDADGYARVDPTMEHPRSVFQLMRAHYSRYTPGMVADICGCSAEDFERAAEVVCSTGTAARAGTILYALGWTQHSHSVQLIHTAAMLQLILGNIGMPGGGINAQRGHSNIQGATDLGAWNALTGYLKIPRADQQTLETYIARNSPRPLRPNSMNYWSNTNRFMVSLLKAYYGDRATAANGYGYDNLPKPDASDDYSWGTIFERAYNGQLEGLIAFGMNPVANGPNTAKMLAGLANLRWLIVAECFETETAAFWKARAAAGEYYPGAPAAADIDTEVFLLPAACFAEKDGTMVNSSRWLQWKYAALDPPGEALRDQDIIARLFLKLQALYREEGGAAPEQLLDMQWNWRNPLSPDLGEVAMEINGRGADGRQLTTFAQLADDGSTVCGNWLYAGSFTDEGNMAARRGQEDPTGLGLYANWAWNWPLNRRILYNRASADAAGNPWDPTRAPIRWTGESWVGDVPDYGATAAPDAFGSFIMVPEGVARLYTVDSFAEGPFPEHYEPVESPVMNLLHPEVGSNPAARRFTNDLDVLGSAEDYPYVATTYRLTEHYHYWTKHVAGPSELQPHFFVELAEELAAEKGIATGDMVRVWSARGEVRGQAMVTRRMRGLQVAGRTIHQVGLPIHWGFLGRVTGPLVNNLSPSVFDPNSGTPEYKGFLVNIERVG